MFGYWSSFIPDSQAATNSGNALTLLNIILKDPSPKVKHAHVLKQNLKN